MKKYVRILMVSVFALFSVLEVNALVVDYVSIGDLYYSISDFNVYHYDCATVEQNSLYTYYEKVVIPDSVKYAGKMYPVKFIGDKAFYNCKNLTSVTIPNTVTEIGELAFFGCTGLTSVMIPNTMVVIGKFAFRYCTGLTSMTIPNSIQLICDMAFYGCTGLTSVTILSSDLRIGGDTFGDCTGLEKVVISDLSSWCNIDFAYGGANPLKYAKHLYLGDREVTDLKIPDGVRSIKSIAFYGCSGLTSVTIPNSVTEIGDNAFKNCN